MLIQMLMLSEAAEKEAGLRNKIDVAVGRKAMGTQRAGLWCVWVSFINYISFSAVTTTCQ